MWQAQLLQWLTEQVELGSGYWEEKLENFSRVHQILLSKSYGKQVLDLIFTYLQVAGDVQR